jgi:hypothetical protein
MYKAISVPNFFPGFRLGRSRKRALKMFLCRTKGVRIRTVQKSIRTENLRRRKDEYEERKNF